LTQESSTRILTRTTENSNSPLKQISLKKSLKQKSKKATYQADSPQKKLPDKLLLQMIVTDNEGQDG